MQIHPNVKVVFVGDSITVGGAQDPWYKPMTDSWARFYGASAPTVVNKGVSGDKVADVLARVASDVVALSPDLVWIEVGVNDRIALTDLTTLAGTCSSLLSTIRAGLPSAQIAWNSIFCYSEQFPDPGAAVTDAYNAVISAACTAGSATYIDVRTQQQLAEAAQNVPSPGVVSGILTAEAPPALGIHPTTAAGVPIIGGVALRSCRLNP